MSRSLTLFLLCAFLLPLYSHGQSAYQSGYLLTNDGATREVLIRERNWSSNPTSITYREVDGKTDRVAEITDLRGFGLVGDHQKFVRAQVRVEQSADRLNQLSSRPEPTFISDTVWLRQFVEGRADLFYWANGKFERYFYRLDDGPIEPLLYRRYLVSNTRVRTDESYRATLGTVLRCEGSDMPGLDKLSYTKKSLLEYIIAFNVCTDTPQELLASREGPGVRLALWVGVETHAPRYYNTALLSRDRVIVGFETALAPRIGIEIEQGLEFTNRRWSFFSGLNYRRYRQQTGMRGLDNSVDSHSLELPLGARFRVLDVARNPLYLMGSGVADLPFNDARFRRGKRSFVMGLNFGLNVGAGVRIGKHLEIEGAYRFSRNLLYNYRTAYLLDKGFVFGIAYRR